MELCRRIGAPHPKTIELTPDNLVQASAYTGFPALIKPNISEGARGIVYVNDIDRLHEVFPSVQATFGACTLQEFIHHSGVYYNVMLYRDRNGKCLGSTVIKILRYFPLKGGTSCYSVSVENPELTEICFRVLEKIDWIGFADFDIMQEAESGDYKIIEINPRTPASLKASLASGVDFPAIILYDTLGHPVPKFKYEPGKILRYMGLDVMWFLFSPDRFRIRPSWFKFFGRNIYYEDGTWSDPPAYVSRLFRRSNKISESQIQKIKIELTMNILTFDIEDWYNHDDYSQDFEWDKFEVRLYEGVDKILEALDRRHLRGTFFCLGWVAEKHPAIIRRIADGGHQIGCHSYQHQLATRFTPAQFEQDTGKAKKTA